MLLWKQGLHAGQWEGGDYDMCVCLCEINQTVVSIWQRVDARAGGGGLISSLKEENTRGNNTRIKQTNGR